MTTFNSTQPNSELIDEELALTSLNGIAGGIDFDEPELRARTALQAIQCPA